MKISVIAGRYAFSGVPLAQLKLAKALANAGHNVELIYGAVNKGYHLPQADDFNITTYNKTQVSRMIFELIRHFKLIKPDIVFSAGDHLNAIVLLVAIITRSKAKISCSSRVRPFDTYSNIPFTKGWILKQVMRLVMSRANVLSCVSQDMVEQYKKVFKSPPHVCIYNIIVDRSSQNNMKEPINEEWLIKKKVPVIIAAGSLVPWKGFVDLILAVNKLLKRKKVKLIILGDGPMRNQLENLIKKLELKKFVKIISYVKNPLKYFSRSDIFALSSHVEGLPNVLVEAMMSGCTPVATNCPTGPREVLNNGKYGYLVSVHDPSSLAIGLETALDKPISKQLLQEAVLPFSEKRVLDCHFKFLGYQ